MVNGEAENWKFKYVRWYHIIEQVFGTAVPHLSDDETQNYVSERDWMIVPIPGEADKNKAKSAGRPNLYFALSDEDIVTFGIVYEKLDSVKQLRRIILPYNERERNELISKLMVLDNSFVTSVNRKVKAHDPRESPEYTETFALRTNKIDHEKFVTIFKEVDKILDEREILDGKRKYHLAPTVTLVYGETKRDEKAFAEALFKIKPIYELSVKARTEEEYEVCKDCLCFTCDEKEEHSCKCPCPNYPRSPDITTECYLKGSKD